MQFSSICLAKCDFKVICYPQSLFNFNVLELIFNGFMLIYTSLIHKASNISPSYYLVKLTEYLVTIFSLTVFGLWGTNQLPETQ